VSAARGPGCTAAVGTVMFNTHNPVDIESNQEECPPAWLPAPLCPPCAMPQPCKQPATMLHFAARPCAQCAPVKALTRCSRAGPALVDQLCSALLAPANATVDSKVRTHIHARTQHGPMRTLAAPMHRQVAGVRGWGAQQQAVMTNCVYCIVARL
jgi:hypothetical protein